MDFIVFDTEDNSPELMLSGKSGFDKQVTQIAAITASGDEYYSRGNIPEFLKWLRVRKEKYIYAHNCQYDLGNLFGDNPDKLDWKLVGGRFIGATWNGKQFRDSYNIWNMPAKKIGTAFKLDKMEMDVNSREYVFRDCEIIRQAMLFAWQFCELAGIGTCPATMGGLAVKLWKHWGGEVHHNSHWLSREAMFGGRVELFKPRNETRRIAYTDINSLYPSAMLEKFPLLLEEQKDLCEFGIADVTVECAERELCVLPYRGMDGEILYPYGKFRGSWTIAELRLAEREGYKILKLHETQGCNESHKPYAEFITRLYRSRLAADNPAEKEFFKLLMNSRYGKCGVSGIMSRTIFQTPENKDKGVPFGEKVLCEFKAPLSDDVNWSHAAYVTAYGRMKLFTYLKQVGIGPLIYTDTDSTIFDCPSGKLPFPVNKELGLMKLESWEKQCECYAPKTYRYGKDYKAKGVPRRLAKEFIQTGEAHFELPFKVREAINFFDDGNRKKLSVWRKVTKQMQTSYNRKRLIDGKFYPCEVRI